MAQLLDVVVLDAAKAEAVGDVVHVAQEPGKAIGQRAVEVEDGEGVGHAWRNHTVERRTTRQDRMGGAGPQTSSAAWFETRRKRRSSP